MSTSSPTSSDASDLSNKVRRQYSKQWTDYKFTSNWEYILISLGSTMGVRDYFSFMVLSNSPEEPTIIHHIICFLFLGLPLTYMQIILGQYSQLSVIFFKHLSPIGHGIGYTLLLNSLVWSSNYGILMADFLMYLLSCIDTTLNWMTCPPNTADTCWDGTSNCKNNCITEKIETSAYVYWKETFMNNIDLNPKQLTLGSPIWIRAVPLFFTWGIVFGIVSMGMANYRKIIRVNLYIIAIFVITVTLVAFVVDGAIAGVAMMFRINLDSFVNPAAWSYAVEKVIQCLALSRAGHMSFGSYMPPQMPSDILTIFYVFLNFVSIFMMSMVAHASLGITMRGAHVSKENVKHIFRKVAPLFTVMPEGLGFMGAPQIWTILYFLASICLLVNNMVIHMDIVHRSIASAHSRIRAYKNYLLVGLCSFCCIYGFMFISKEGFVVSQELFHQIAGQIRGVNMFIMCFLTLWIYRVQRLSDDIHFLQGTQPTKFWKIFWYISPCVIGFSYIYVTFIKEKKKVSGYYIIIYYLWMIIQLSPIPVFMFIEIGRYLRTHNLVGIVQPEERWGPPDPEERHLRHLFNPRQEIRSRRRDDTCQHNCLLGSKYLKKVVAEERDLREIIIRRSTLHESTDDFEDQGVDSWIM